MKSLSLSLHERVLTFHSPLFTSGWTLTARRIILVELHDPDSGFTGWGEAAPLQEFGTESYEESKAVLEAIAGAVPSVQLHWYCIPNMDAVFPQLRDKPAARFAFECALTDLISKRVDMPLREFIGTREHLDKVPVNALIAGSTAEECYEQAEAAAIKGYSCLKAKVGAYDPSDDMKRLTAIREGAGESINLRIDANGAWNREQALEALEKFRPFAIEYCEQPVPANDFEGLAYLSRHSAIPIAADESVHTAEQLSMLLEMGSADVYILKPMALGGLYKAMDAAREVLNYGKKFVFTSLLDSIIARTAVAQLAATFPTEHVFPQGLGTGALFMKDMIHIDPVINGNFLLTDKLGLGVEPLLT